jgi:hypothetical protein
MKKLLSSASEFYVKRSASDVLALTETLKKFDSESEDDDLLGEDKNLVSSGDETDSIEDHETFTPFTSTSSLIPLRSEGLSIYLLYIYNILI